MIKFRKVSVIILIIELLLIALLDVIYIRNVKSEKNYYRVEVERLVRLLENDEHFDVKVFLHKNLKHSPEEI